MITKTSHAKCHTLVGPCGILVVALEFIHFHYGAPGFQCRYCESVSEFVEDDATNVGTRDQSFVDTKLS